VKLDLLSLLISDTAEAKARFVSRGDDSGTHTKEQELLKEADLFPGFDPGRQIRESENGAI